MTKQTAKPVQTAKSITAGDAKAFAHSVFIVDSAATAREVIDATIKAWRKAGVRIAPRNCPNRDVLKAAVSEQYPASRVPDVMYCIALAINEGVPFSTNKKTMTDKVKAKGVKLAPNRNKTAANAGTGAAQSAKESKAPSKAVVSAPSQFKNPGEVLEALANAVQKIQTMAGADLWERAMKAASIGTGDVLAELIKANM